ncbi:MAG: hypothetical protein M5U26_15715 [Planctomycetota bacterium]|nr:hypothetical protein [Planctomycetota bacterium]
MSKPPYDPDRERAWRWKAAAAQAHAELNLLYEPGNWGDVLKGTWAVHLARTLAARAQDPVAYVDPYAGSPDYPLVPASARRLEQLGAGAARTFLEAQAPHAARGRLASTGTLVREAIQAAGVKFEARVFDAEADRQLAWARVDGVEVLELPSGEATLELEARRVRAAELILIDPYDFLDRWGAWLPKLKRAALRSSVLVYLYDTSPRGAGHANQYRRFRKALEAWAQETPILLGRLAADARAPRAYHEMLLAGALAEDAGLRERLREESEALAGLLGHGEGFGALGRNVNRVT